MTSSGVREGEFYCHHQLASFFFYFTLPSIFLPFSLYLSAFVPSFFFPPFFQLIPQSGLYLQRAKKRRHIRKGSRKKKLTSIISSTSKVNFESSFSALSLAYTL